jgi:hypothetical protein
MPSKFILAFLRVAVTILFYFMILITLWLVITFFMNVTGYRTIGAKLKYNYEVEAIDRSYNEPQITYSKDSLVYYKPLKDHYMLDVKPNSLVGYYAMVIKLISMGFGMAILWNFMKIFKETKLDNPFSHTVTKRLKILAILFIIGDVLKLADYFFFKHLINQSLPSPRFELIAETGDGLITGLIIWIIAIIYQRGIELQEENALTV